MKNLKMVIIAVVMVALIGGYFYYLTNREAKNTDANVEITELQEVLSKQLDRKYPPTPREVIKFYNRILTCAYGGEYDDAQFDKLAEQARKLMDDELLESNPKDVYKETLRKEVASYKEDSRQIIQTGICESDEVRYKEIEGRKCAYVQASYFTREGKSDFFKAYEDYLLRQDNDGNWKILAFKLVDREEAES